MALGEFDLIRRYFEPLSGEGAFGLRDDAARIRVAPGEELVVTADMVAVSVHFLPDDPPGTIAQKALRVNLSDLASKGATPLGYLLSAAFPKDIREDWIAAFCAGLKLDQDTFGIALLGGDTISSRAAPFFSITAFGTVPEGRMVHRFAAQPGDSLYVSGEIGSAAAGLAVRLGRSAYDDLSPDVRAELVDRYRVPRPRMALAPAIRACARAAMDVSDGLIGDCDKMVAASGCSAMIDADAVPVATGLRDLAKNDLILASLLTGGDDYEILAAIPPEREAMFRDLAEEAGVAVTRIGDITEGSGDVRVTRRGRALPLGRRSYDHGSE